MSLHQILDDIQGDVTNTHVSAEEVVLNNPKDSTFKVSAGSLNKNVLDKFNTLYQTLTAKNTVYQLGKVDFKIAQEVFTMLPEFKHEQAKLTSHPSTINKNILEGVLKNVSSEMPDEILSTFRDISEQIRENADAILGVINSVTVYGQFCEQAIDRFTKARPLVIENKESIDLFEQPLFRCAYLDDTQLDYDKYANTLSTMFGSLANDSSLSTFMTYRSNPAEGEVLPKHSDISLHGLCEKIAHLKDVLQSEHAFLSNYVGSLDSALTDEVKAITANSEFLVNNANGAIDSLNFFKMLYDILEADDQFFEKTKTLIDFID